MVSSMSWLFFICLLIIAALIARIPGDGAEGMDW